MPAVTLRAVEDFNREACLALRVAPEQAHLVATVEKSLKQAAVQVHSHAFAIYDVKSRGVQRPTEAVVGFVMYEVVAGVGFVERLLIDRAWQGRGYGLFAMREVVRRLKLYPDVELIATSHRKDNAAMAGLLKKLDFVPWHVPFVNEDPGEIFMRHRESLADE